MLPAADSVDVGGYQFLTQYTSNQTIYPVLSLSCATALHHVVQKNFGHWRGIKPPVNQEIHSGRGSLARNKTP